MLRLSAIWEQLLHAPRVQHVELRCLAERNPPPWGKSHRSFYQHCRWDWLVRFYALRFSWFTLWFCVATHTMLTKYQNVDADLVAYLAPGLTRHCVGPCPQRGLADPGSDQLDLMRPINFRPGTQVRSQNPCSSHPPFLLARSRSPEGADSV